MRILSRLHGGLLKQIILVRHTRPALAEGICYGRMDLELAPTWPQEFEQCLAQIPRASLILSSPSSRCLRLAQALGSRDTADIQIDERLLELNFGEWEGRAWDDIPREGIDEWVADPVDYAPGNGESLRTLWMRVLQLREVLLERLSGTVVIVAHHGPLRALMAQAAGRPMESMLDHQIAWGGVIAIEPEPRAPK
jgi:alpha-ribazole phosphatase